MSTDRQLCCKDNSYLISVNGSVGCGACHGKIYLNGKLCCPSSTYADLSSTTAICQKIGTGPCSDIKINQDIKVCCPSNQYYHIGFKRCLSPGNSNCNTLLKICCSTGQRL